MKKLIFVLVALPMIIFAKSNPTSMSTDGGQSTEYKPRSVYGRNFVGVEVLGRGVLYSLNYDRSINSRFSVGAGLSYYQFNIVGINIDVAIVPIYGNYYLGGPRHRALITGGASVVYAKAEIRDAYNWNDNVDRGNNEISYNYARAEGMSLYPNAGIGYEFRANAGFTARVTTYYQYANNQMYPWLGATLGTHF